MFARLENEALENERQAELEEHLLAELVNRRHKKQVACVVVDSGYHEVQLIFSPDGAIDDNVETYFNFSIERPAIRSETCVIGHITGNHVIRTATRLWPHAHIVWSPCGCCCKFYDYRKDYPGSIPNRRRTA